MAISALLSWSNTKRNRRSTSPKRSCWAGSSKKRRRVRCWKSIYLRISTTSTSSPTSRAISPWSSWSSLWSIAKLVTYRTTSKERWKTMSSSRRWKYSTGLYRSVWLSITCMRGELSTETWNRRTSSWRAVSLSNWATSVLVGSSKTLMRERWLWWGRHTICHRKRARANHTPPKATSGPWESFCTSSAS